MRAAFVILSFLVGAAAYGEELVAALDRNLLKTHMRQETGRVKFSGAPVPAFAPTTIQCPHPSCSVRVEVSSQFFNVTSGNIARIHVKANDIPFPSTGFDIDGGINRPVATQTTAAYLRTGLGSGSHTITVDLDMRSPEGTAEAGIRTLLIQVFAP